MERRIVSLGVFSAALVACSGPVTPIDAGRDDGTYDVARVDALADTMIIDASPTDAPDFDTPVPSDAGDDASADASDAIDSAPPPTDSGTAVLKAPCRGLMTRSGPLQMAPYDFVDSAVLQLNWSDIEPSDDAFDWSMIDSFLATARTRGIAVRLRVLAGVHAPNFVKRLGHAPMNDATNNIDCSASGGIAIYNRFDMVGGCSSFFWMTPVLDQYRDLMNAISARYDNDAALREVVDSACMTTYAEPFFRAHVDSGSNQRLFTAGLDTTSDHACHTRALADMDAAFHRTRISVAINAWDIIDGNAPDYFHTSWRDTYDFVTAQRTRLGGKLVLQNNGWGEMEGCPAGGTPLSNVYCYLPSMMGPHGYQTETLMRLGSEAGFFDAVDHAVSAHMNFIEMPAGWMAFDRAHLAAVDAQLESQACCAPVP